MKHIFSLFSLIILLANTHLLAQSVELIKTIKSKGHISKINQYSKNIPVVVHYTSTDGSCSHCMKNNLKIQKSAKKLKGKFKFVQIIFNPWRSYLKTDKHLKGLPEIHIRYKGVPTATLKGFRKNLTHELSTAYDKTIELMDPTRTGLKIPRITVDRLPEYAERNSQKKILLLHISSTDPSCNYCAHNNRFMQLAAKAAKGLYNFVEVNYDPWRLFSTDNRLKKYLKKNGYKVRGLPVLLSISKGKIIGIKKGVYPQLIDDVRQK